MMMLDMMIHFVVALVSLMLGLWLAMEVENEKATQALHEQFFAWEVEDDLRQERRVTRVRTLDMLWRQGRRESCLQLAHAWAIEDKALRPVYDAVLRAYSAHNAREALVQPARDAKGRFAKGNPWRFPRRTARAMLAA